MLVVAPLVFTALAATAQQAERPDDLAGWQSVKWGMTPDEAKVALGDQAQALSEETARAKKLVLGNGQCPVRLVIPKYDLAGRQFEVNLAFDPKAGLRLVTLRLPGSLLE